MHSHNDAPNPKGNFSEIKRAVWRFLVHTLLDNPGRKER